MCRSVKKTAAAGLFSILLYHCSFDWDLTKFDQKSRAPQSMAETCMKGSKEQDWSWLPLHPLTGKHSPVQRLAAMHRPSRGNPGPGSFPAVRPDPPPPRRLLCREVTAAVSRSSCTAAGGLEVWGYWGPRRPTTQSPARKNSQIMMSWFTQNWFF